jgi:Uma2 family endonuclease
MPPCARLQAETAADVVGTLGLWAREHAEFSVGTKEAGMRIGEDTRGADAAVWRRSDPGAQHPGFARSAPVLAVEVAGRDEGEAALREKARWYLAAGAAVVWLLFPAERRVVVVTPGGERAHHPGERLPAHPGLPGLAPLVDELFRQVSAAGGQAERATETRRPGS